MSLKKLVAALVSASILATAAIVAPLTATAAEATETVLYEFDDSLLGVVDTIMITDDAMAAINKATSSVAFTVNGALAEGAEWCNYGIQMVSSPWTGIWSKEVNTTFTLTSADAEWASFIGDTSLKLCPQNIKVSTATVAVDGGEAITVYDVTEDAVAGMEFASAGKAYYITPDQLTEAGVTADNIADCKLIVTVASVAESGVELSVMASNDWETNQLTWTNSVSTGANEYALTKDGIADAALTGGINFCAKNIVVSKFVLYVPEEDDKPISGTTDDGTISYEEVEYESKYPKYVDTDYTETGYTYCQVDADDNTTWRIYMQVKESDLADKTTASIKIQNLYTEKAVKLTTNSAYKKLSDTVTAQDGCVFIVFVIENVTGYTEDASSNEYSHLYWGPIEIE